MAYTIADFKTKKALKEAVAKWNEFRKNTPTVPASLARTPEPIRCYQPNSDLTGSRLPQDGTIYLEGPHFPAPHTWYAQAELEDGIVVKVK